MSRRTEEWRDVPGYGGWYQISTDGRVVSYRGKGTRSKRGERLETPKPLHPRLRNAKNGPYQVVSLYDFTTGKQRTHTMTRLMAETWIKNLPPNYIVHLKNHNPADVRLSNMVVTTRQEWMEYMREKARQAKKRGYCKKLPVVKIDLTLTVVDAFPSVRQASLATNIDRQTILHYCNHKAKRSSIAPDGFIYAWDDSRRIWATLKRVMRELDEMGIRYNSPFTGRYFDLPAEDDLDLDPADLWWSLAPPCCGGGGYFGTPRRILIGA